MRRHFPAASRPPVSASGVSCSPGTARTDATFRGAGPTTRITSSCPRSCCSRRRSIACCRNITSGWTSIHRSRRSPTRRKTTSARRGGRSATTSARGGCSRSRANRSTRYGGQLPSDDETLLSFKGIGAYTAGAIRSFAFGQRAAILDTNVARVLFRVFVGRGDPKAHAMRKQLWGVSEALVPYKHVFDFNQALMDFGATVCTARKPKCDACPMARSCTRSRMGRAQTATATKP